VTRLDGDDEIVQRLLASRRLRVLEQPGRWQRTTA
jgi:hypothetical protein